MKGSSSGAAAGVLVGAAALVGLSLTGPPAPAPEAIGVVMQEGAAEPASAPPEEPAPSAPAEPVAEAAPEVERVPETESAQRIAEVRPVEKAPLVASVPTEEAPPEPEVPVAEAPPDVPLTTALTIQEADGADRPATAPVEVETGATFAGMAPAPEPIRAEALSPEEVLDIVAPAAEDPAEAGTLSPVEAVTAQAEPVATGPAFETVTPEAVPGPAPVNDAEPAMRPAVLQLGGGARSGRDAVRVNRPGAEAPPPEAEAVAVPEPANPDAVPALRRFAAAWEAPDAAMPRLAIVLLDDGATDPRAVAALPWPVSVAIDPSVEGAAERLAAYRAAGLEALVLARLPTGAQPVDVEVFLGAALKALPETVAVLDLGEGGLAGRGATGQMAMSAVARDGRGVLFADDGLRSGLDLALREGVPAAEVLRDLDGQGQDAASIQRGLDDAARRAGQEGSVVVLARVGAGTLAALSEWSARRRAQGVTVAPVSAVLAP